MLGGLRWNISDFSSTGQSVSCPSAAALQAWHCNLCLFCSWSWVLFELLLRSLSVLQPILKGTHHEIRGSSHMSEWFASHSSLPDIILSSETRALILLFNPPQIFLFFPNKFFFLSPWLCLAECCCLSDLVFSPSADTDCVRTSIRKCYRSLNPVFHGCLSS